MNNAFVKWLHRVAAGIFLIGMAGQAHAVKFDDGPIEGNIDTTLSYGTTTRLSDPDEDLYCIANGGRSNSCNTDDGNLNYKSGLVSQVHKLTTDIDIKHKHSDTGAFIRLKGFVDYENNDPDDTQRTPLTNKAIDLVGENFDVLDAYIWKKFDISPEQSAEIRVGKHVLNWGESTFIQGGINAVNPIDAAAIRLPGSELREALLPVNMFSMSLDITENMTMEGFYQFDWDRTIPDPSGSYFSTNDFATDGGSKVQLGFGSIPDSGFSFEGISPGLTTVMNVDLAGAGLPTQSLFDTNFLSVPRGSDNEPDNSGQWGLALRYFSEELNDTEFGFYYMNYHSRLPVISAQTGSLSGLLGGAFGAAAVSAPGSATVAAVTAAVTPQVLASVPLGTPPATIAALIAAEVTSQVTTLAGLVAVDRYAATTNYIIEYPDDIDLLGFSFNTSIGEWALQGEFSHKQDVPLQIDDVEILFAALTPLGGVIGNTAWNQNQVGVYSIVPNQYIQGYIRRDVSQMQATVSKVFSNIMGADQFAFVAEAAVTHVHNMPDKDVLRLDGPATNVSGNPFHATAAGGHAGIAAVDSKHFPDATSWGYRLAGRWTFNDVYRSVNLSPRLAFQHDVDGITPGPGGNFIEGRKAVTVGLTATYKNQWAVDVGYTDFYGAGDHNLLGDRDFVGFNIKYSF